MPMVRRLARHTLLGLEYIHSRGAQIGISSSGSSTISELY